MGVASWPRWVRWLLFVPAAFLGASAMHFVLTLVFAVKGGQMSVAGIEVEGAAAFWIQTTVMRFLEPLTFVGAGGFVAPTRKVPSIALAVLMSVILGGILALQLVTGRQWWVVLIPAAVGIAGAVVGAVTAIRQPQAS